MKNFCLCVLAIVLASSCRTTRLQTNNNESIGSLKLIGQYNVPYNLSFDNTTVGGLSGIDYDPQTQNYYLICDDRSAINPARFYTARLYFTDKSFDSVAFTKVTYLLNPQGQTYPDSKTAPSLAPDPEAMRFNPKKNCLVWSSEGERIVTDKDTILNNPAVYEISLTGKYLDSFALPSQFVMKATENGPRRNGVFEGIGFSDNFKHMFVSLEEPRYEDGPRSDVTDGPAYTRIIKYNVDTRQPIAQYAYKLEPIAYKAIPEDAFKVNGISDILALSDTRILTIERSFSTGIRDCTIKLFITDLKGATDIKNINSLKQTPGFKPASKKLLFNFASLNRYIDNIEGVTFGPILPNGHQSLIFVADNNFSDKEESQFFLFEVVPSKQ
ncbi:esterase-like activity of phytase family protein [Chitinophaga silvatica]|uniref:Esterase-like activity of phytase family protein n=1 Tax=Chitinophaga silvatica TaxID=2282649 RepID=A0A3E1YBS2_9BACT|nr:esterase-like activity of phytase family protein [Chitinophaga silvatica]RFS23502.1 esterase-like activity of phytase family protein [Chitinophaga silvatica]